MEYYSVIKKNEILPLVTTWMDLEGLSLSEISQTKEDKNIMISLLCRTKKQRTTTNQAYRCREQIGGYQRIGR